MNEESSKGDVRNRRSEPRRPPGKYYSVQFSVKELAYIYQFKIWDESDGGLSILINEESEVVRHISVGNVIDMKYYVSEAVGTTREFKTEIRHIKKQADGRFKGHYLVGLKMLDA